MTVQQDGSVLFAVYGTLRQGNGNHRRLAHPDVEFLGTIKTPEKYTMYSLGGFPGVAEEGKTAITAEIYRTSNKDIIDGVCRLEGYSGVRNNPNNWYDTCDIETEWGLANMFTMNGLNTSRNRNSVIESGDWME